MIKDQAIASDVRKRQRLEIQQWDWYEERIALDKKIAAVSRQIRRLSDDEIAKAYNTTRTRVRKVMGLA